MSLNIREKLVIGNTDEFKFDKELNNGNINIIRTNKKKINRYMRTMTEKATKS